MEALDSLVKAGKVRALGASAMYGYQFYNMQLAARDNGWTPFSAMENHYNLLYREDERELIPICEQMGVSLMPYSALAAGHLARPTWNSDSLRSKTDRVAMGKYDRTEQYDIEIVKRVAELAEKHGCRMSQIALAWHWARGVASPILGATKAKYFDEAVGALDIKLSEDELKKAYRKLARKYHYVSKLRIKPECFRIRNAELRGNMHLHPDLTAIHNRSHV